MLETIERLDSAFAVTDSRVMNDSVERAQTVGLIGDATRLGDTCEVADHGAPRPRRGGVGVSRTGLAARVEDHVVTSRDQSPRGHEAETVG